MGISVRRLEPEHDRSGFRSGNLDLDRFFLRYAGQNQFRHHIGTTYVAIDDEGTIAGFATVTASELSPDAVPSSKRKALPRYPVPVLRLARLAVDERFKNRGIGSHLIRAVLVLAAHMSEAVGSIGVVVDSKPESAGFYERLGFVRLELVAGELGDRPVPVPMFLEIGEYLRGK